MSQTGFPFLFIRGGSSRGPYFKRSDLPESLDDLSEVLINVVGSGHPLNIDGIGGGNAVTTKVAMLSKSNDEWADIDYFFAQVSVEDKLVDFKPTCGNIMIGVGPAAIEMGLFNPTGDVSQVKVRAVNTGAKIIATVQTPGGKVNYAGDTAIDGVPGTAAPIGLEFTEVAGSNTGQFLPTGEVKNHIEGVDVTCMDFAMPMVIAKASDFGITGYETQKELDANKFLFMQIEKVRLAAGLAMGMGDCSQSVTPKFGLVAPAQHGGSLSTRYFMPWTTHPTLAVTGSQCFAACALTPGSIAYDLWQAPKDKTVALTLEHPLGNMEVVMNTNTDAGEVKPVSATLVRTARLLAKGEVFVPNH